ncbi:tigger transposable element-derived protein 4-like [Achroia grisella]|uniref:tigger transposable element-derived protein 4-like n=1 Tax=Achroia grisella TaxID=688607 RepID=UPI0027D25EE7|nr:tigger transposable element-derived protein 4-like [Achroia grisella]
MCVSVKSMATISVAKDPLGNNSDRNESSSDDECLLDLKRKYNLSKDIKIQRKYDNDSDEHAILPEVLVKVEVEEIDDDQPLDYTNKSDAPPPKKKKKRKVVSKPRTFPCPSCDKVFDRAPELREHSIVHQVQTRHKCEHCGRYFNKAFSLRMHMRVHVGRELKCPLCDLTFSMKINLGRHLMSHERTEECTQCPAKFHTKKELDDHNKSHMESPPENKSKSKGSQSKTEGTNISVKVKVESEDQSEDLNSSTEPEPPVPLIKHDGFIKRDQLSHPTQCAIVSKMHKGRSIPDICRLYNLTPEVVNEIWEDREKYILPKKAGKRSTKYMNKILDNRIVEWFHNQRSQNIQVSGKMLQDIAEAFAKDCGFVAFNGSKKWLDRFKKRYSICLRGTPSKRDYHNLSIESKWKKQFFKENWCDVRFGIPDEDIYTADEVGLYYNPSKGRIKKLGGKKFIQGYAKDRLSIFMCTNVSGLDKKKLFVCGIEDPLLHSHRDPDTLPVTYIRHCQAHFTTSMFEEYVKYWNRELQVLNKKAVLILDRATIHTKLQLSHLKLVFVPWKASTGLMPIKNGIFIRFREEFRRLIIEEKAMNALRGIDRNLTCLEALHIVQKAWDRTPPEIITKAFIDTGYDVKKFDTPSVEIPKIYDNDEEMMCNMLKDYDVESYFTDLSNLDMYLTVDEELLTGQGTNGSVFGGNHKVIEPVAFADKEKEEILPLATEKPESDEKETIIKKTRALEDLETVRRYLLSNNTSYETYCSFMEVEKCIMKSPIEYK